MSSIYSLPQVLERRMSLVAQAMAERVDPGAWIHYSADEGLVGRFTKPSSFGGAPTVEYYRKKEPRATIILGFLRMVDIKEEERGPALVIENNIEERHVIDVSLKHAIHDVRKVEHSFERTTSFSEAAKKAWEVAAKASLSVEYAGIKGALEVSGKYGEELARQSGTSETTRDVISETFEFTGPIEFQIEAYRSRNREERVIKARCDFDGKIYFSTGSTRWEFTTFLTQFMPIAKGIADDSIYGYQEFMDKPMSDAEIAALEMASDKIIEFPVQYDNVLTEHLREI